MPKNHGHTSSGYGNCCVSKMEFQLSNCFRLLWEQHIYWTRMVILAIAFGSPDLEATTNRLLRNAPDFAKVFSRFYDDEIADEFGRLITDHLKIAAELVTAAKAGNSKAAENAERRWYKNADEIACFLAQINDCWSYEDMRDMWFKHLALTKDEAVAILNKKFNKSISIFDQIEILALKMADSFTCGIVCQFGH